jgi:type IV pilus assembly protein PilC
MVFFAILGYKKPAVALITVPFVCLLLGYGVFAQQPETILYAPVIFLITLSAILVSGREPGGETWPHTVAKWILLTIVFLLLLAVAFVVFGAGGIIGLLLFAVFIASIIRYGLTSRHTTAVHVMSTIGASMRQNLPLPMALESAANARNDKRSRILLRIRNWLVQGYPVSEAIKRGYPRCPGYALALIAATERVDQVPLAMSSIEADMVAKTDERKRLRPVHPFYPVILVTFILFVVMGLMWRVVPALESILAEMFDEATLPAATQLLRRVTALLAYEGGWPIALVLAIVVLVVIPGWIWARLRTRRPERPYLLSRVGDYIKWHLPILHWYERNYSTVQVIELLRLSLNAGCTVNDAIANTLRLDVNSCFRKRLKSWLAKVEAGENIAAAARQSKLPTSLAWVFDDQVNQSNTLEILETLESFYRSNYSYRVNLARFVLWPCVSILLGVIVGFVVYALFSPLIAIVQYTATQAYP